MPKIDTTIPVIFPPMNKNTIRIRGESGDVNLGIIEAPQLQRNRIITKTVIIWEISPQLRTIFFQLGNIKLLKLYSIIKIILITKFIHHFGPLISFSCKGHGPTSMDVGKFTGSKVRNFLIICKIHINYKPT